MKANTTPINTTSLNQDPETGAPSTHLLSRPEGRSSEAISAEQALTNRIFREGNGRGLIKFCRELSVILIRQYTKNDDVGELREKLCSSLMATLRCSHLQAQCLIDLSLELIHAKVHGKYRRSNVELSYLIATATGAVGDVSSN